MIVRPRANGEALSGRFSRNALCTRPDHGRGDFYSPRPPTLCLPQAGLFFSSPFSSRRPYRRFLAQERERAASHLFPRRRRGNRPRFARSSQPRRARKQASSSKVENRKNPITNMNDDELYLVMCANCGVPVAEGDPQEDVGDLYCSRCERELEQYANA